MPLYHPLWLQPLRCSLSFRGGWGGGDGLFGAQQSSFWLSSQCPGCSWQAAGCIFCLTFKFLCFVPKNAEENWKTLDSFTEKVPYFTWSNLINEKINGKNKVIFITRKYCDWSVLKIIIINFCVKYVWFRKMQRWNWKHWTVKHSYFYNKGELCTVSPKKYLILHEFS